MDFLVYVQTENGLKIAAEVQAANSGEALRLAKQRFDSPIVGPKPHPKDKPAEGRYWGYRGTVQ